MEINYIDVVIAIPLLYGLYTGVTKGLILSASTLIGLILGIYCGVKFSHYAANLLFEKFEIDIPILAFAVTFIVIMLGMYFLGKLLSKFAHALALGIFNYIGGAIFGIVKVALVLMVIMVFFESINQSFNLVDQSLIQGSLLYQYLKQGSEVVFPYMEQLKRG